MVRVLFIDMILNTQKKNHREKIKNVIVTDIVLIIWFMSERSFKEINNVLTMYVLLYTKLAYF